MERRFGLTIVAGIGGAAFVAGACVGWFALGAPRGVDLVADNGSTADWVAAIGALVTGLAAVYFAGQAHLHRVGEVNLAAARSQTAKKANLTLAAALAAPPMTIKNSFEEFFRVCEDSRPVYFDVRDLFERVKVRAGRLEVSQEALSYLSVAAVATLANVNNGLVSLSRSIDIAMEFIGPEAVEGDALVDPRIIEELRTFEEVIDDIHSNSDKFMALLIAEREIS